MSEDARQERKIQIDRLHIDTGHVRVPTPI